MEFETLFQQMVQIIQIYVSLCMCVYPHVCEHICVSFYLCIYVCSIVCICMCVCVWTVGCEFFCGSNNSTNFCGGLFNYEKFNEWNLHIFKQQTTFLLMLYANLPQFYLLYCSSSHQISFVNLRTSHTLYYTFYSLISWPLRLWMNLINYLHVIKEN